MSAPLARRNPPTPAVEALLNTIAYSAKVIPIAGYVRPTVPDDFDWSGNEDELAARLKPYSDPTPEEIAEAEKLDADPGYQALMTTFCEKASRENEIDDLQHLGSWCQNLDVGVRPPTFEVWSDTIRDARDHRLLLSKLKRQARDDLEGALGWVIRCQLTDDESASIIQAAEGDGGMGVVHLQDYAHLGPRTRAALEEQNRKAAERKPDTAAALPPRSETPLEERLTKAAKVLRIDPADPNYEVRDGKWAKKLAAPLGKSSLMMVRASDVTPQKIEWLWQNRVALGKFSIVAGNPGLGKSQLATYMAAAVSTGGPWPNGEGKAPLGSVIIMSAEDDAADTLVPRLIAAGADLDRVHIVEGVKVPTGEKQFHLSDDIEILCDAIDKIGDVRLVSIDPVTAYLGNDQKVDSHKNAAVRSALAPLQSRAARLGFAALGVSHLNKGGGSEALMRVLGSLAFVAASRSAYLVVREKDTDRSLFLGMKNNIGPPVSGLAFRMVPRFIQAGFEAPAIEWGDDEIDKTADEALAESVGRDSGGDDGGKSSVPDAMSFLRDVLVDGAVAAKEVQSRAREASISKSTLNRAKKRLDVTAHHRGEGGVTGMGEWVWELPPQILLG